MRQDKNQAGIGMIIVMVAFLVLFAAFTLIKIGTLDSIQPDLQRIGIGSSPSSAPLAVNQNSGVKSGDSSTQSLENSTGFETASNNLEIDEDSNEGDNPSYIE